MYCNLKPPYVYPGARRCLLTYEWQILLQSNQGHSSELLSTCQEIEPTRSREESAKSTRRQLQSAKRTSSNILTFSTNLRRLSRTVAPILLAFSANPARKSSEHWLSPTANFDTFQRRIWTLSTATYHHPSLHSTPRHAEHCSKFGERFPIYSKLIQAIFQSINSSMQFNSTLPFNIEHLLWKMWDTI